MKASMDVRKLAHALFERVTRYCLENRVLLRARFLVNASGELASIPFSEPRLDRTPDGGESEPVAIFTLRDSLYRCYPAEDSSESDSEAGVPDGWIADGEPHHCLNMRIEVPGQKA